MELDEIFVCYDCDKIFRSDSDFKQHVQDCNENGLSLPDGMKRGRKPKLKEPELDNTCEMCGATYTSQSSLGSHISRVHKDRSITCNDCGKIFQNNHKFGDHRTKVHGEEKPCPECGIVFREYALRRHIRRIHTNKSFHILCPDCGKQLQDKRRLLRHKIEVHLKLKPFKCDECEFMCASISNLNLHRKNIHNHQKPLQYGDFKIKSLKAIMEEYEKGNPIENTVENK